MHGETDRTSVLLSCVCCVCFRYIIAAYNQRVSELMGQSNWEGAIEILNKLIAQGQNCGNIEAEGEANFELGNCYSKLGDPNMTLEFYTAYVATLFLPSSSSPLLSLVFSFAERRSKTRKYTKEAAKGWKNINANSDTDLTCVSVCVCLCVCVCVFYSCAVTKTFVSCARIRSAKGSLAARWL